MRTTRLHWSYADNTSYCPYNTPFDTTMQTARCPTEIYEEMVKHFRDAGSLAQLLRDWARIASDLCLMAELATNFTRLPQLMGLSGPDLAGACFQMFDREALRCTELIKSTGNLTPAAQRCISEWKLQRGRWRANLLRTWQGSKLLTYLQKEHKESCDARQRFHSERDRSIRTIRRYTEGDVPNNEAESNRADATAAAATLSLALNVMNKDASSEKAISDLDGRIVSLVQCLPLALSESGAAADGDYELTDAIQSLRTGHASVQEAVRRAALVMSAPILRQLQQVTRNAVDFYLSESSPDQDNSILRDDDLAENLMRSVRVVCRTLRGRSYQAKEEEQEQEEEMLMDSPASSEGIQVGIADTRSLATAIRQYIDADRDLVASVRAHRRAPVSREPSEPSDHIVRYWQGRRVAATGKRRERLADLLGPNKAIRFERYWDLESPTVELSADGVAREVARQDQLSLPVATRHSCQTTEYIDSHSSPKASQVRFGKATKSSPNDKDRFPYGRGREVKEGSWDEYGRPYKPWQSHQDQSLESRVKDDGANQTLALRSTETTGDGPSSASRPSHTVNNSHKRPFAARSSPDSEAQARHKASWTSSRSGPSVNPTVGPDSSINISSDGLGRSHIGSQRSQN